MNKEELIINSRSKQYAALFLAENKRESLVTDALLEKTFKDCVIPPQKFLYEKIKIEIENMRNDGVSKFYYDYD